MLPFFNPKTWGFLNEEKITNERNDLFVGVTYADYIISFSK
ncbi:hypothetical protein GCM10008935_29770 [Alkalibacillus silvisoli]|uniref:Uncharacterized protein n=1 Tax=Alkalibacillus silvisoli TaxID=392823 RepID=A0ABN1AAV1_9BACI